MRGSAASFLSASCGPAAVTTSQPKSSSMTATISSTSGSSSTTNTTRGTAPLRIRIFQHPRFVSSARATPTNNTTMKQVPLNVRITQAKSACRTLAKPFEKDAGSWDKGREDAADPRTFPAMPLARPSTVPLQEDLFHLKKSRRTWRCHPSAAAPALLRDVSGGSHMSGRSGSRGFRTATVACRASVGLSTIKAFESGRTRPIPNNEHAIQKALEDGGMCFTYRPEGVQKRS